jgi:hypothetical protein
MFTASGEVVQPSEVLYRKPILVERGSFRPATRLTLDLLERARERFVLEPEVRGWEPVVLAEMTLNNLRQPDQDLAARHETNPGPAQGGAVSPAEEPPTPTHDTPRPC